MYNHGHVVYLFVRQFFHLKKKWDELIEFRVFCACHELRQINEGPGTASGTSSPRMLVATITTTTVNLQPLNL